MATAWPEKDDHELLALIQDGNGQAFAMLVERHTERFYRLAYRYLQSKAAAEDVVQDAFLKLWENPAIWQPEHNSKFTTWFYRVVVNLCLDLRKRKGPDRKSTRLNSSHVAISYAVFCLKKKKGNDDSNFVDIKRKTMHGYY